MAQGPGQGPCRGNDASATHDQATERVCGGEEEIGGMSACPDRLQSIPVKANERVASEDRHFKRIGGNDVHLS
jgi:hypothetical protein